jgi:hypothetical protein
MADRMWFTQKLKRYNVKITALSNDIMKAHEFFNEPFSKPENVAVVIKPPGNLEVIEELTDGANLLMQVQQLVKIITQLDDTQVFSRITSLSSSPTPTRSRESRTTPRSSSVCPTRPM